MDSFTVRGLVFSILSSTGLGYELYFVAKPRLFLVVMYGVVILLGLILIFFVQDQEEN